MRGVIGPVGEWLSLPPLFDGNVSTAIAGWDIAVDDVLAVVEYVEYDKTGWVASTFVRVEGVGVGMITGATFLALTPCECPTCGGAGEVVYGETYTRAWLPCPTCTGPVTVTGDGPIVEVSP
jgi:hypothetical protein